MHFEKSGSNDRVKDVDPMINHRGESNSLVEFLELSRFWVFQVGESINIHLTSYGKMFSMIVRHGSGEYGLSKQQPRWIPRWIFLIRTETGFFF